MRRALVLLSRADPDSNGWPSSLRQDGADVTLRTVPMASSWDDADAFGGVLLPQESIRPL